MERDYYITIIEYRPTDDTPDRNGVWVRIIENNKEHKMMMATTLKNDRVIVVGPFKKRPMFPSADSILKFVRETMEG